MPHPRGKAFAYAHPSVAARTQMRGLVGRYDEAKGKSEARGRNEGERERVSECHFAYRDTRSGTVSDICASEDRFKNRNLFIHIIFSS